MNSGTQAPNQRPMHRAVTLELEGNYCNFQGYVSRVEAVHHKIETLKEV